MVLAMDGSQHILVVDDDKEIRALLSGFLLRSGYRGPLRRTAPR
jgi:CheY-like chemotaxis protein